MATQRGWRLLILNAAIAVAYAGLGWAFLLLANFGASAPLWPPAGLAFAVALRWRFKAAPGILLGSLVTNTAFLTVSGTDATPLVMAALIGTGATIQALAAAALVRRFVERHDAMSTARDILLFLLLAGPAASVISATVGTATQVMADVIPAERAGLAWLIWWAGDSMGVIVFGPLTLMFLPDPTGLWPTWRLRVGLPSLAFTTVLMIAIMASLSAESSQLTTQRRYAAQNASAMLQDELEREQEVLEGIGDFIRASDDVSAADFRVYTRNPLSRYGSLQALSWDVSLTSEELRAFIEKRRQQLGGAGFTATERADDGSLKTVASGRDQYVLVDYIEPLADNREALGYDIASNPARRTTIDRAQQTGETSATGPIDLVQDNGDSKTGMLVLNPVYDSPRTPLTRLARQAEIRGFAVGVYQLGALLNTVFTSQTDPGNWDLMSIALVDITDPDDPVTLATRGTAPTETTAVEVTGPAMPVMGRTWQIILTPTGGPLSQPPLGAAPYLLLIAMAGLYLLEAFLILLTARERQAKAEAAERTHEANHDALTGLLNRRGFLRRLELICEDAAHRHTESVLLFCDLDRFKGINDAAGHLAGDQLLTAVAGILKQRVRQSDVVARLGGDEFAIILVNCPIGQALPIASSIWSAVEDFQLPTTAGDLSVTVSIGVALIGAGHELTPDEALRQSDTAAYTAKKAGGGGVHLYDGVTQA